MTTVLTRSVAPRPIDDRRTDAEFTRIVDELTRRGFLGGAIGAAGLLGLAACGSDASPRSGSSSNAPGPRQVPSVHGEITVPLKPTRVVTTDGFSMAAMFDLGINPVGVYSAGEQYVEPQFLSRWRTIPKVSSGTVGGAIDVEKVAALHPDLILGIDGQKPPYAQLKDIAPTVILPFNASAAPWRDMAKDTAVALGRTSSFTALQRRYTTTAARIKTDYADVLSKLRWDVIQGGFDAGQFSLYGPSSPIGSILADAGVQFANASAATIGNGAQQSVSYEKISELSTADALFYYADNSGAPANLGPKLFAQEAFRDLPAAKAKHTFGSIYFLPSGYSDAIGALSSLKDALVKLQVGTS